MVDDAVRLLPFRTGGPRPRRPRTVDDALRTAWPDAPGPRRGRDPRALGAAGHPRSHRPRRRARGGAAPGRPRDPRAGGRARPRRPHLGRVRRRGSRRAARRGRRRRRLAAAAGPSRGARWPACWTPPWSPRTWPAVARALFAVDLHDPGVRLLDQEWASRGLAEIPSTAVAFDDVARDAGRRARLVPGASRVLVGRHRGGGLLVRGRGRDRSTGARRGGSSATTRCSRCTSARSTTGSRTRGGRSPRLPALVDAHDARRRAGPPPGQAGPGDRRGRLRGRADARRARPRSRSAGARGRSTPSASPTCRSTCASSTPSATTSRWGRRSRRRRRRGDVRRSRTGHPGRRVVRRPAVPRPARARAAPDGTDRRGRRASRRRDPGGRRHPGGAGGRRVPGRGRDRLRRQRVAPGLPDARPGRAGGTPVGGGASRPCTSCRRPHRSRCWGTRTVVCARCATRSRPTCGRC